MGQQPSKDQERLQELWARIDQTRGLLLSLLRSEQAVYDAWYNAVLDHYTRLQNEKDALLDCIDAQCEGRSLPIPDPTPPLRLPPLPEPDAPAAPAPSSAGVVEPGTPAGGASVPRGQQGGGISSEEGGHAGGAERSEVVPLWGAGAERMPPGLRRRHGLAEGS